MDISDDRLKEETRRALLRIQAIHTLSGDFRGAESNARDRIKEFISSEELPDLGSGPYSALRQDLLLSWFIETAALVSITMPADQTEAFEFNEAFRCIWDKLKDVLKDTGPEVEK